MQIAPPVMFTARILFCLLGAAALMILALVSCEQAHARGRHRHHPRPHPQGSFCAPVIMEGAGMVRICGIPAAARR